MLRKLLVCLLVAGITFAHSKEVILYTSHDRNYSDPVVSVFQKKTGITVKRVFDTEATKTAGLTNRIMAEKSNPKADVFWNNEIVRTILLKKKGCLAPYISPVASDIPAEFKDAKGYWTGFAARSRIILVNTEKCGDVQFPQSIFDFVKPEWSGKICIANPLFGTTSTHCAVLFAALGNDKATDYFSKLKSNKIAVLAGNGTTKDRVAAGVYSAGFTDTDDGNEAQLAKSPVRLIFPDQDSLGTLLIPNTVALIKGCKHPDEAGKLIDFLLSHEVEAMLAASSSVQIPVRKGIKGPPGIPSIDSLRVMAVDFEKAADIIEPVSRQLEKLLLQ